MEAIKQGRRFLLDFDKAYKNKGKISTEKWCKSTKIWQYVIDVVLTIAIIVILVLLPQFGYIPVKQQGFYCGDPSISYPYTVDTISIKFLLMIMILSPIVIFFVVEILSSDIRASMRKICSWYGAYTAATVCFLLLSQIMRIICGELRPNFLNVCTPDTAQNCTIGEYISEYRCLNTGGFSLYMSIESGLSFPSGHAGFATITSLFCAIYIHVRFKPRHLGVLLKPAIIITVLAWGIAVSITRVVDHMHHWWDVIAGISMGIALTIYTVIFYCDSFKVEVEREKAMNKIYTQGKTTIFEKNEVDALKH